MPLSWKQGHGRTNGYLLCLTANLFFSTIASGQPSADTGRTARRYRYYSFSIITGAGVQFFDNANGTFGVNFPYTVTDASGNTTATTFTGQKKAIYTSPKYYISPLVFEMGRIHSLVRVAMYFSLVKGTYGPGFHGSVGYGRIFYTGRYAIKLSVDLTTTSDSKDGQYNLLGTIDNKNKTISVFGQTLGPTFTVPASRNTPAQTFTSNTVNVSYSQNESSLLPRISLLPNPFRHHWLFELSVGYNIPFHDHGQLNFIQEAEKRNWLAATEDIRNNSFSASYDGKPAKAPPFRFGGVYVEVLWEFIGHKEK